MIQLSNGQVKWSVTSTDGSSEFVIVGKVSVSIEQFHDMYIRELHSSSSCVDAYEKAEKLHEELLGCRKYKNYRSFKVTRSVFNSIK